MFVSVPSRLNLCFDAPDFSNMNLSCVHKHTLQSIQLIACVLYWFKRYFGIITIYHVAILV